MRLVSLAPLMLLLLSSCATMRARDEICDGEVQFIAGREFVVNSNADKLICGDPKVAAWKDIPPQQQQLTIKSVLAKSGFHRPSFELENGRLLVDAGVRSRIIRLEFLNPPDEFFHFKPPHFEGRPLTAETLNEIEDWAQRRLGEIGYPCASVKLLSSLADGLVLVRLTPGEKRNFPHELDHSEDELKPSVQGRYQAFHGGMTYQHSLLRLSSQRMEIDGAAARSIYVEKCASPLTEAIPIAHRSSIGLPRAVQLGFGFNTEEFFLVRASWKNYRLGSRASLLGATARASFIQQQLLLYSNLYVSDRVPRAYLAPKVDVRHTKEADQEYNRITGPFFFGTSHETRKGRLQLEAGPRLFYENVIEGPITGKKSLLLGDSEWIYQSHDYEVNQQRPMQGIEASLQTSSILSSLQERPDAHRLTLRWTWLLNLNRYSPARWVLGIRGKTQSLVGVDQNSDLTRVPIDYFTWLGGDDDLRGFDRKELPYRSNGALTSAYVGTELRSPALLGPAWDPLVLFDLGMLGEEAVFRLDPQLYYSVGAGTRYQSPIGVVRMTLARGFIPGGGTAAEERTHLQFFISLGSEF